MLFAHWLEASTRSWTAATHTWVRAFGVNVETSDTYVRCWLATSPSTHLFSLQPLLTFSFNNLPQMPQQDGSCSPQGLSWLRATENEHFSLSWRIQGHQYVLLPHGFVILRLYENRVFSLCSTPCKKYNSCQLEGTVNWVRWLAMEAKHENKAKTISNCKQKEFLKMLSLNIKRVSSINSRFLQ